MTNYVTKVVETGQKLSGTGFNISNEWTGSLLLAGLPEKFAPMIMAIEDSDVNITTDTIKTKLLDMEPDASGVDTNSAFATKHWQQNTKGRSSVRDSSIYQSGNSNAKNIKCYKCKQPGHYKNQCRSTVHEEKRKQSNAFSAIFLNGNFNKKDWYIDSGASVHMTANENWVRNVSYQQTTKEIVVANKCKIPVSCAGDIQIETAINGCSYDITVKDVLCVPDLTTNLLSVSQLINNGNKVSFKKNGCYIYI